MSIWGFSAKLKKEIAMVDRIPKVIVPEKERKKRIYFSKKSCGLVLFFIIIILILYVLFFSSIFKVKNVEVRGNNLVNGDNIKKLVEFSLGRENNIFLFDDTNLEKIIKENFSLIQELSIQKGLPDTLRILIIERHPVIFWESGGKRYYVDNNGYAYMEAPTDAKDEIVVVYDKQNLPINPGQKVVSKNFISFLEAIRKNMKNIAGLDYDKFEVYETTFDLSVLTKNGFVVFFDTLKSPEEGLDNLRRVILHLQGKKPKAYIDLRVEGWAYYK